MQDSLSPSLKYKRILLKISGEALRGDDPSVVIEPTAIRNICKEIQSIYEIGAEIGLVVGGGNIFRGLQGKSINRTTGDKMGMLATIINALAIRDTLEQMGVEARVQSSIAMDSFVEPFVLGRAISHLKKNRVVIFGGGLGSPYFSTDTTAAVRGNEIEADIVMKATKVDGIYDKDPMTHPEAVRYEKLSFVDTVSQQLKIMDLTAFSLCLDNQMPILVFNMNKSGNCKKAVLGEKIGTYVS